jgi:Flp pilus assembly protein TadD
VDRSAPLVQILTCQPDPHFDTNREIRLRWMVRDENLSTRPVRLHYCCGRTKAYRLIADLLPVDGSYRWTVPQNVSGRLKLKVSATDRAGNSGRCVVDQLKFNADTGQRVATDLAGRHLSALPVAGAAPPGVRSTVPPPNTVSLEIHRRYPEPPTAVQTISEEAASRAKKLYDLGTWHRLRGENAVAVLRYTDALELDPNRLEARNDLGGLLLLSGRHEEAEQAFRQVLKVDPRHVAALKSLALVQAARQNYRSARDTLQRLLLIDPLDADAWLYFGDVTMFMGNRQPAREAWQKVGTIEQAPNEVKERARKRLAIYKGTSTVNPRAPAGEPARTER